MFSNYSKLSRMKPSPLTAELLQLTKPSLVDILESVNSYMSTKKSTVSDKKTIKINKVSTYEKNQRSYHANPINTDRNSNQSGKYRACDPKAVLQTILEAETKRRVSKKGSIVLL